MTLSTDRWKDRRVLVLGAGRSGCAAAALLGELGARVTLSDLRPLETTGPLAELERAGVALVLGEHPRALLDGMEAVVVSPGIPPDAEIVRRVRQAGLPLTSELELAAPYLGAPAVAITGSNGKSTVTSLVGEILRRAGYRTAVCGNIGLAVCRVAREVVAGRAVYDRIVLELSSFQTETIERFRPRWAGILNLSPDHLDRHGDLLSYARAKLRLLHRCRGDDVVVYCHDDALLRELLVDAPARRVAFGEHLPAYASPAARVDGGVVWIDDTGRAFPVATAGELPLIGRHNLLNAAAAVALACLAGATPEDARAALLACRPLPHRMESCGRVAGVECIDDSKATNVGATIASLEGLDRRRHDVWLILGGRDKGAEFGRLRPVLQGRVRCLLLIGEAAGLIAASLQGVAPMKRCDTLERAVATAFAEARAGDVLLLAPACTSFDQYTDFEARGRHFRELVERARAARGAA